MTLRDLKRFVDNLAEIVRDESKAKTAMED
jgi:hypothetical protein